MTKLSKNTFFIFTDESFDPRSKIGVACKLVLNAADCQNTKTSDFATLPFEIKDFEQTNSARLELEAIFWALTSFETAGRSPKIALLTDSKIASGLLERRSKLQQTNYMSVKPGIPLASADLFKEFFVLHDRLGFEVVGMEPPASGPNKNPVQILFSAVVKHADKTLRDRLKSQNQVASKWF